MQKTQYYNLNQWEAADKLSRADFNADNATIDAAIKAVETAAADKASAAEVTALSQSVNTELAAVNQTVSALSETVNAHKIAVGSYTGNGGTQTISVGFTPKMVLVFSQYLSNSSTNKSGMALQGKSARLDGTQIGLEIVTNGFTVRFDATNNMGLNYSNYLYYYFAVQ